MTNWLAFDIGTTGTKAILMDASGQIIRSAYRDYPTHTAPGGIVEQDANAWWQAICETARELDASDADAIALTGQMQDLILVNDSAEPLRPVILYSDTRSVAEAQEINTSLGADRLVQTTGNSQDAGSLLAKLLWIARHEPDKLRHTASLLFGAADYAALQLTGQAVSDTTTASSTGLLDLSQRTIMSDALLTDLGLQVVIGCMPQIVAGGTHIGEVTTATARKLRVRAGLPVFLGPGDAGATTIGAGSGEVGHVYGYIGSSGWVAFTSEQRADPASGAFSLAHPRQNDVICIAPLLTAGGNLDWLRTILGSKDHADLIDAALAQPPSSLVYLPYLNGERAPFSDPFARGAFIGLSPRHKQADLCRAVLEGVVFAYRHAIDSLVNAPLNGLLLTGGGTRSQGWCQLFADITATPLQIASDAENVGVRGAVLAAQVMVGHQSSYAPVGFIQANRALRPDPKHQQHYERQYELFRAAYTALKPIFARIAAND